MVRTEGVTRRGLVLAAMGWACAGARGQPLAEPSGSPVLTLRGKLKRTNRGDSAVFDMAMLEGVAQHSFSTKTPWFKDARARAGPGHRGQDQATARDPLRAHHQPLAPATAPSRNKRNRRLVGAPAWGCRHAGVAPRRAPARVL